MLATLGRPAQVDDGGDVQRLQGREVLVGRQAVMSRTEQPRRAHPPAVQAGGAAEVAKVIDGRARIGLHVTHRLSGAVRLMAPVGFIRDGLRRDGRDEPAPQACKLLIVRLV